MSVSRLTSISGATAGELQLLAQRYNRTVACSQSYYIAHKDDPKATSPFPDGCFIVIKDDTQSVMDGFVDQMYPVGSVYMNALVDTNPNSLFHFGTWNRITGSFLYAADGTSIAALDIGGNATVTLTQENLPATATFTIPALSGTANSASTAHIHTIGDTSTAHTHSVSAFKGGYVNGLSSTAQWVHNHRLLVYTGGSNSISNVYGYSLPGSNTGGTSSHAYANIMTYNSGDDPYIETTNINHYHEIPGHDTNGMSANSTHSHTCGAMSANETHTHTVSIPSAEKTISDFGSGTAFSILPPYTALNVWYRVN